jgi:hypothetical protein
MSNLKQFSIESLVKEKKAIREHGKLYLSKGKGKKETGFIGLKSSVIKLGKEELVL